MADVWNYSDLEAWRKIKMATGVIFNKIDLSSRNWETCLDVLNDVCAALGEKPYE